MEDFLEKCKETRKRDKMNDALVVRIFVGFAMIGAVVGVIGAVVGVGVARGLRLLFGV